MKWERYFPAGFGWKREVRFFLFGLISSAVYFLLHFSVLYGNDYYVLFERHSLPRRVLREGAMMEDFHLQLEGGEVLFAVLAAMMLLAAGYHLLYHFQGSKSIYLMRRLPDRGDLPRRCLAFPLFGLAIILLTMLGLTAACYIWYMVKTPAVCLRPGQLQKLMAALFGGAK